jgi:hypothetical protein
MRGENVELDLQGTIPFVLWEWFQDLRALGSDWRLSGIVVPNKYLAPHATMLPCTSSLLRARNLILEHPLVESPALGLPGVDAKLDAACCQVLFHLILCELDILRLFDMLLYMVAEVLVER